MSGSTPKKSKPLGKPITLAQLFVERPPGTSAIVSDALRLHENVYVIRYRPIKLYCDHEECESVNTFEPESKMSRLFQEQLETKEAAKTISYTCRHCRCMTKLFAIHVTMKVVRGAEMVEIIKIGEFPPFDQSTPRELLGRLGPNRELFHKGKLSESNNLGIGAFEYYKRVVENQKKSLLNDIITICAIVGADGDIKKKLEAMQKEKLFLEGIDSIDPDVPECLYIDGHNPLTLLYGALSQGLKENSDKNYLKLAQYIRVILIALAQKMDAAVSEDQELKRVVSDLVAKTKKKS